VCARWKEWPSRLAWLARACRLRRDSQRHVEAAGAIATRRRHPVHHRVRALLGLGWLRAGVALAGEAVGIARLARLVGSRGSAQAPARGHGGGEREGVLASKKGVLALGKGVFPVRECLFVLSTHSSTIPSASCASSASTNSSRGQPARSSHAGAPEINGRRSEGVG